MNNIQDDIAAQKAGIVNYRAPSYGKFSTKLQTQYWFGVPRNILASGLVMDVDRVFNNKVHKDNSTQKRLNFNRMIGARLSAMEHIIPELMFSIEGDKPQGISAVKAIAIASSEGQKIWTITRENVDIALASITLDIDTETEIRNSANAGMVITTHEKSLNFNGWIGEGYIILDPQTGAGAYKIAGGGNGGILKKLNKWLTKGMFFAGSLLSLQESNYVARTIIKSLGVLVSTIFDLITIWSKCSGNIGVYLSLFAILSSLAIAVALFFATGGAAIFLIGMMIPILQSYVVKKLSKKFC
jgi:hypothetical protein